MSEQFPELKSSEGRKKCKLDWSNYAKKADLKIVTGVDTSKFATMVILANLKTDIDKLDIDKLENVPTIVSSLKIRVDELNVDKLVPASVDLSKLSNALKNDVVRRDVYNAKIKNIEGKVPDITNLATKTTPNAKTNEANGKNLVLLTKLLLLLLMLKK